MNAYVTHNCISGGETREPRVEVQYQCSYGEVVDG